MFGASEAWFGRPLRLRIGRKCGAVKRFVTAAQPAICGRAIPNQQHSFSIQVSVTTFGTVPRGGQ
jgi:hypothetical protein